VVVAVLAGALPLHPQTLQTVDLTGTVSDNVTGAVVDGADVVLFDSSKPPKEITRVITGSNGKYVIPGLKSGDHVAAYYRCGGYLPYPGGPVTLLLGAGENVMNFQLMANTDQAAYWSQWAKNLKGFVDSSTVNAQKKQALYDEFWSYLGLAGFSPISQALAARSLTESTPGLTHSPAVTSFASVDVETVRKADSNISAALSGGQATLLRKYPIPPDVAVAIAASELKKRGSSAPPPEFMETFGSVWGQEATGHLSTTLSSKPAGNGYQKAMDRMHLMANKPTLVP
jgi:hypothetical protein